jgi:hypothetical protein
MDIIIVVLTAALLLVGLVTLGLLIDSKVLERREYRRARLPKHRR